MVNKVIKETSFKKFLLYLTIISGFFGCAFLQYDLGPFSIFPFRIFLIVLWFFFILSILLSKGKLNISQIKAKNYLLFLGIWLSYAILSLSWADYPVDAIRHIAFLFMGCSLIFFAILYFNQLKDLYRFYLIWIIITIPLIGIGLWEVFTGNHLPNSNYFGMRRLDYQIFRPSSVFGNTNDFASFLTLSIPFVWVWMRYSAQKWLNKIIGIALLAIAFFLLAKTSSRANFLAVALEILFIFFFLFRLRRRIRISFSISLIIILSFIFLPQIPLKIFHRTYGFFENFTTPYQLTAGSTIVRINLIKNSIYFLVTHFGFGVGAGNIEKHIAHFAKYPTYGITNPHNWWVEILADYGLFIFIGYLFFYLGLIYNLWRTWHKISNRQEKMICEALLISLIGFSLASISPSSIMALEYHWIFFAFVLAFLNYFRLKSTSNL